MQSRGSVARPARHDRAARATRCGCVRDSQRQRRGPPAAV